MSGISSNETMSVIYQSLRGLSLRQKAEADNIANLNTPGYIGEKVNFEDALRQAAMSYEDSSELRRAKIDNLQPQVTRSTATPNANGNNVSLDSEVVSAQDTALRYSLMTQAMGDQFKLLRMAAREGRA